MVMQDYYGDVIAGGQVGIHFFKGIQSIMETKKHERCLEFWYVSLSPRVDVYF